MMAIDVQRQVKQGYRMDLPARMPEEMQAIVLQCWSADPAQRPNFNDLVELMERIMKRYDEVIPAT